MLWSQNKIIKVTDPINNKNYQTLTNKTGIDQIKQNRIFSFTSRGSNFETHECIFSMIISPHEKIKRA